MESSTSTRMWRALKAANRPWPVLDDDPVIDYMLTEAVAMKAGLEEKEAREAQERKEWKKDRESLKELA